jgi:hypothetical protein
MMGFASIPSSSSVGPCATPTPLTNVLAMAETAASDNKPDQPDCSQYDQDVKDCRNDAFLCIALSLLLGPDEPVGGALCLIGEKVCMCRAQGRHPGCAAHNIGCKGGS